MFCKYNWICKRYFDRVNYVEYWCNVMNEKNKQNISIVGGQFKLVLVPLKRQSVLSGFAISDLSVWSVLFAPVSKA